MGSGFNAEYVMATREQSQTNLAIARDSNSADRDIAKEQSQAVIKQAELDYKARIYEADKNASVQLAALEVREKEAELDYKVRYKEAQNDSIRADASMVAAQAKQTEAEAKVAREERKADNDRRRYESQDNGYFYG